MKRLPINPKRATLIVVLAAAFAALCVLVVFYFKDREPPTLSLSPDFGPVNEKKEFTLKLLDKISGVKEVQVSLVQGDKTFPLTSAQYPAREKTQILTWTLEKIKLKDGPFQIRATAKDGSIYNMGKGNVAEIAHTLVLDTKPPRISVQSLTHNLNQGGAGCVAYTVSEDAEKSGVLVGDFFFPGYRQASGEYACLFAFPHSVMVQEFRPELTASDAAENQGRTGINYHANPRTFRKDTIRLPSRFLDSKMPQFEGDFPGPMEQIERFLKVNRELRTQNRKRMLEIGQKSEASPLWQGRFIRLPNAATRAGFADKRTYLFEGKKVDSQTHMGIDLASIKHASVPGANAGKVVHTGAFGIYGNSVVLDHGLGLMTLYAHLSEIHVDVGDIVEKGQTIGRTGATGLAGGDHLHFGVYVSGVPVNPLEWWDKTWIKNNISGKLKGE
ncbi:MAG: M23 family metallopeptidase [Thermodesulfobacteriota bacterium]|nr:M23 family metallopeptidase [Thermodesulfobacteriota bacterium]